MNYRILIQGQNIGKALSNGLNSGLWGGAIGGLSGGITGGIRAARSGNNFWSGNGAGGKYGNVPQVDVGRMNYRASQISTRNMLSKMNKPIASYTDSHLEFNGSQIDLINNYCDGYQCVADSWDAVSGPFGNGALPNGNYVGENLRLRTVSGFTRDGVGFSLDLNPQFETSRTLLRIHPDGGISGTLGCIGLQENADRLNVFYNTLSTYFQGVAPLIHVIVY